MGGHALVHKRAEHFLMPPRKLLVIGLDTPHVAGTHPLWRADAKDGVPDARFVDSLRKHGIIQPIRARKTSKDDTDTAEVVVGRERVKAARILEAEGVAILVPTLLWPMGTPIAEIIGVANAENYQRKHETVIMQAEHVHMQLRAEGYFDGVDENDALRAVTASTGFNAQRIRNLMAFREDAQLTKAVDAGKLRGEAALAIATIADAVERAKQLAHAIANPDASTIVEVRERVAYAKANIRAQDAKGARGRVVVHNGAKPARAADRAARVARDTTWPGISKPLQKRIVEGQSTAVEKLDPLVLKTLRACAGLAGPNTVPGLTKAMRALGLLGDAGE